MSFVLTLFAIVAVQKNVRDLAGAAGLIDQDLPGLARPIRWAR
jgi:hypothetical protein